MDRQINREREKEKSIKERFFGPSPKLASDQMTLMASHKCPRSACNDIRRKTFLVFRHHFYQHFYHYFLSAFLFWRLKMWPGFLMLITSLLLRFLIRLKYLKIYEKIPNLFSADFQRFSCFLLALWKSRHLRQIASFNINWLWSEIWKGK